MASGFPVVLVPFPYSQNRRTDETSPSPSSLCHSEWNKCVTPYLEPFLAPHGEDAEAVCKAFLAKIVESCQEEAEVWEDDGEEEELCNCVFSLGYGGKILLRNTRLWLKRGRQYGLCGANGAGKSTLMRAISVGKLDGFPSSDVLKSVYVEHKDDTADADFNPIQLLTRDPALKGVTKEMCEEELTSYGFTDQMLTTKISSLSGGWKMKLQLARAILMKADILLLGE